MSEMDKFMGKSAPKAKEAEPAAMTMPVMTAEQFTALLAAMAGARVTPKTEAEIKAEAEADRLANAAPNIDVNDRVWITLSDNKSIGRGGQFFGVNGASFLLKPGKKAHVPRALMSVLNDAIEGIAIVDPDTLDITEYRQVLRYPYQVHATGP